MYTKPIDNPHNPYGARKLYKVLNVKKYMNIKDGRATRRIHMPRKTLGLILTDNPSLDKIPSGVDIVILDGCWEFYIYDAKTAEATETLAKRMDAVAYYNV